MSYAAWVQFYFTFLLPQWHGSGTFQSRLAQYLPDIGLQGGQYSCSTDAHMQALWGSTSDATYRKAVMVVITIYCLNSCIRRVNEHYTFLYENGRSSLAFDRYRARRPLWKLALENCFPSHS